MSADNNQESLKLKSFSAWLGMATSIVLLAISAYMGLARQTFLSEADIAPGMVISLNAGGAHPQIEFAASDGKTYRYPQGGMIYGYRTGQAVEVLYLQKNPQLTAVISDTGAIWGPAALIALIGLGFGVLSMLTFYNPWEKNGMRNA